METMMQPVQRNTFFHNARGLRSGWRLLLWLLLASILILIFLIPFAIMMISMLAANGIQLGRGTPLDLERLPWWENLLLQGVSFILAFLTVFLAAIPIAVYLEKRPTRSLGLAFHSRWLQEFLTGTVLGALLLCVIILVLSLMGFYHVEGLNPATQAPWISALLMGMAFLGVGLFEEFFERGYLFQNLINGVGFWPAVIISCTLFASLHLFNPGENPLGILEVFAAGVLFLILVVKTRSLWLAVGFHAAWDWCQSYLFGVPDSGMVLPGSLLQTRIHGPDWLSGGHAGPEGSVIAILATIAVSVLLVRARWIRPSAGSSILWDRYIERKQEDAAPGEAETGLAAPFPAVPGSIPSLDCFDLSLSDQNLSDLRSSNAGRTGEENVQIAVRDESAFLDST